MFTVTREWLYHHASASSDGTQHAWTKDQIQQLGVAYPPSTGWIQSVVGSKILPEHRERFEMALRRGQVKKQLTGDLFA
jgi:hypothetical protein